MNRFYERLTRYIYGKSRNWRAVMTLLSAMVVFSTTYALILPAITLDTGTANEEPGIEVGEGEIFMEDGTESENHKNTAAEESIVFEDEDDFPDEAEDGFDPFCFEDMEDADGPENLFEDDEDLMEFEDHPTDEDSDLQLITEDADNAGLYMIVREGSDGNYYAMSAEGTAIRIDYNPETNTGYYDGEAEVVWTRDGNCFSNNGAFLDVTASAVGRRAVSDEVSEAVVNPVEDNRTSLYTIDSEGTEEDSAKYYNCLVLSEDEGSFTVIRIDTKPVNRVILAYVDDVMRETSGEDDLFIDEFEAESVAEEMAAVSEASSSVSAVEEMAVISDESAAESVVEEMADPEDYSAGTKIYEGDDYTVTVIYDESAGIPEDAELKVSEILPGTPEYDEYYEKSAGAISENSGTGTISYARFFDICFVVNERGWFGSEKQREIEPETGVEVSISYKTVPNETVEMPDEANTADTARSDAEAGIQEAAPMLSEAGDELSVLHFTGESVDMVPDINAVQLTESEAVVNFEAPSFSVYAIVYTVDFEWTSDGKTYRFNLSGGGMMAVSELAEALGILGDALSAEEFRDSIENVEFSNEDLVRVVPVTENITGGGLKQKLDLEPDYSDDLPEGEIEQMDSKIFCAPEWVLVSMQAFSSEETLTITMKNGDAYRIAVTDARISKEVITAKGENYRISVIYDENAQIPDGAELLVREILPDTEEYSRYLKESADEIGTEEGRVSFARFFDIEITSGEEKIEPADTVQVEIEYDTAVQVGSPDMLQVVHFADDGTEVIRDVFLSEDSTSISYQQDSFSVTGTIISSPTDNNDGDRNADGHPYMVIVTYQGNDYIVNSDGTLSKVEFKNATEFETDYPMMWEYTELCDYDWDWNLSTNQWENPHNPRNRRLVLRHKSVAKHLNPDNQVADAWYYKYIDPGQPDAMCVESAEHDNWSYEAAIAYSGGKIRHGDSYLGVGMLDGKLRLVGTTNPEEAVNVRFAEAPNTLKNGNVNHSVNHIDIAVEATTEIHVPLAYGTYYDANGNVLFEVSKQNPKILTLNPKVPITHEDIKRATITAYTNYDMDNDGKPDKRYIDDAFYVTGYSSNLANEQSHNLDQVRIEGVFKVADLPPYEGRWMNSDWYNKDPNLDREVREERLKKRIYYAVSTTKVLKDLVLKDENGKELYDANGNLLKITASTTVNASFDYWDPRNECPPIKDSRYWQGFDWVLDNWKHGWIHNWNISGMDFVLGGTSSADTTLQAVEISKFIVDPSGNKIYNRETITNNFTIYHKPVGNPGETEAVIGKHIGQYNPNDQTVLTQGYSEVGTTDIKVIPDAAISAVYDYDIEPGMVYIAEDPASIPRSIIDKNGQTWNYSHTRIETESVWRNDAANDGKTHVSRDYPDDNDNSYSAIPEALGPYTGSYSGNGQYGSTNYWSQKNNRVEDFRNDFLEFYVYNVYEPSKTDLKVEKHWVNSDAPEEAQVELTLKRGKLVPDGSGKPPVPPDDQNGTISIHQMLTGDTDNTYSFTASYTIRDSEGNIAASGTYQGAEGATVSGLKPGNYTISIDCSAAGYTVSPASQNVDSVSVTAKKSTDVYVSNSLAKIQEETDSVRFRVDRRQAMDNPYNHDYSSYTVTGIRGKSIVRISWTSKDASNDLYINGEKKGTYSGSGEKHYDFVLPAEGDVNVELTDPWWESTNGSIDRSSISVEILEMNPTVLHAPALHSRMKALNAPELSATPLGITNEGKIPTIEGYTWVDDTEWEQEVSLPDGGNWWKNVEDLDAEDGDGNIYVYYIESASETGMPDGTTAKIDLSGENKLFVYGDHKFLNSERTNDTLSLTNIMPLETEIHILKVENGTEKPLTGAEFTLHKYTDGTYQNEDGEPIVNAVDENGSLNISALGIGFYKLEESGTPEGYVKISEDPRFEVVKNPKTKEIEVNFTNTDMVTYSNGTFTVRNEPGAALPSAGGSGTIIFMLPGWLLLALACTGISLNKRRKRASC